MRSELFVVARVAEVLPKSLVDVAGAFQDARTEVLVSFYNNVVVVVLEGLHESPLQRRQV